MLLSDCVKYPNFKNPWYLTPFHKINAFHISQCLLGQYIKFKTIKHPEERVPENVLTPRSITLRFNFYPGKVTPGFCHIIWNGDRFCHITLSGLEGGSPCHYENSSINPEISVALRKKGTLVNTYKSTSTSSWKMVFISKRILVQKFWRPYFVFYNNYFPRTFWRLLVCKNFKKVCIKINGT